MSLSVDKVEVLDRFSVYRQILEADKVVLVVVDIQERLLPPIFNKDILVKNSQLLVHAAKILDIPIVVTTQYAKGLGPTVPEIAELIPDVAAVDKVDFSCFAKDEFGTALNSLSGNRNTLILCGMESHICVMQTALAGLNRGYLVHVASDAIGSRNEWNWQVGMERMQNAGCVISCTEMIIYEMMKASGTPQFKQLLKYIK